MRRMTAWILLIVICFNAFGGQIGMSNVYATDYEAASEEAEDVIRAAEKAAGIGTENEEGLSEDTAEVPAIIEEEVSLEQQSEEDTSEEEQKYDDMTISSSTTLTEDIEVENLYVNNSLYLNGHKVIVHGKLTLSSSLYIQEGYLVVEGDFEEDYYGYIEMNSYNDYIKIGGDYIYNSQYYSRRTMNKGTLEIQGDIKGKSGNYCLANIVFGESCTVLLNGDEKQTIDIATNSNLVINHIVIENSSEEGVISKHMLRTDKIDDSDGKLHYLREGNYGITLTEDMVIEGEYCLLGGTLDLAGYELIIKGNLIHAGGTIQINGGSLKIEGDYRRQFQYEIDGDTVDDYSTGRLVMQNESDYVLIQGNYIDSGMYETGSDLTAGTLELYGSILANDGLTHPLLQTTGSHTVKLTGTGKQQLQTGSSYGKDYLRFCNLVIAQPESGSVEWQNEIAVTGSVTHESGNIEGTTRLEGATVSSGELYGNVRIPDNYTFQSDVIIHGNLSAGYSRYIGKSLTIDNCHVTVEGNYYHINLNLFTLGENAVFTVKKDFVISAYSYNEVTTAVIEIGGNITKEGDGYLICRENTEVRFIGSEEQKVAIPHARTLFTNIVVDNPAGVMVEDNIAVINVSCKQGVLSYASGGVHGFTVEEDGEYDGDLVIGGGVLDLNGHSYHVKGNLTIAGGTLNMTQKEDYLLVDGDFKTTSTLSHSGRLTDGVLELKGNFSQSGNEASFAATKDHKIVFSGAESQKITLANSEYSYFSNIEFLNEKGVSWSGRIYGLGNIKQDGPVDGLLAIKASTVLENEQYDGDIEITETMTMNSDWNIGGSFYVWGNRAFNVNGKNLVVGERIYISRDGCMNVQHGRVDCKSLTQEREGYVYMLNEDDQVNVKETFAVSYTYNNFQKGHMTVGGDILFNVGYDSSWGSELNLELNGTSKQTITMNAGKHCFGNLILNNQSEEGIYVTQDLNYKTLDNTAGSKVTFANGGILGYTLEKDEVIDGDLLLSGGTMNLNGYQLTITGNLLQSSGTIDMNGGTLVVNGDYALAEWSQNEDASYTYNNTSAGFVMNGEEEELIVKGDLHQYSAFAPTNGVITVEGNWNFAVDTTIQGITLYLSGNLNSIGYHRFNMSEAKQVVFRGSEQQIISEYDDCVALGNVVIENEKGIQVKNNLGVRFYGELTSNGYPIEGWVNLYGDIVEDNICSNVNFVNAKELQKDLYVDGDVWLGKLTLNEHHLTVAGDCKLNSGYRGNVEQQNGILEVKGNLNYLDSCYYGKGTNKVILSGDEKQIICSNNMYWEFQELVINNTSEEGVYSEELLNVNVVTDPEHKLKFSMDGECGYKLSKDTVIQGDLNLLAGKMDLNGYKLTVMGNLLQRGGTLDVNDGTLQVNGNYTIGNPDSSGNYQTNKAFLKMNQENDLIYVEGNVIFAFGCEHASYLTNGIMEVKGDVTFYNVGYHRQYFGKDFKIKMTGKEKQVIRNKMNEDYFRLGTLEICNSSGVVIEGYLRIINPVVGSDKLSGTAGYTLDWNNGEIPEFERWSGNLSLCNELTLQRDLTVEGKLSLYGQLDVNGHHLTAGSMWLSKPLVVNGGIVQVKDNVEFGRSSSYNARIVMAQEEDIVQITGNITTAWGTLELYAGQLDLKGNVNFGETNVIVGDTHTTTLSGKMTARGTAYVQTVTLDENAVLNKLVLTKPRDYYIFSRDVESMCKELVDDVQDITAPSVPEGLTATDINYTKLKLSWQSSKDDTAVAGYDIYRNDKKIMSVTGTSFTDKNLVPGTEYSYYVIAKDATLNTSAASKTLNVTTLEDDSAPTVPEKPELTERMGNALKLSWQASTDNVKTTGYKIYRDGEEIATTSHTEYLDSNLDTNSPYTYQVLAYDAKGNESELSEESDFYTQTVILENMSPENYSNLSGSEAIFQISFANAGSTNGYHVYMGYRENGQESYTELMSKIQGEGTSYRKMITAQSTLNIQELTCEEIEVLVRITDAGGYETEETYTFYIDKSAPSKLSETGGEVRDGVAVISYAKGVETDIAGYYIYRQSGEQELKQIADITETGKTYYYDTTIENGITYTYYVAAYDQNGYVGEMSDAIILTGNVDESSPVIEQVEPAAGTIYGKTTVTVHARDNKKLDKAIFELSQEGAEEGAEVAEVVFEQGIAVYELDTTKYQGKVDLSITIIDEAGNVNETEWVETYTIDNEGPGQIQNFNANVVSTTAVLTWDAPSEDDFSYFLVEEQQDDETWKEIARTTTVTGYAIEGLIPLSSHTYRVTAYDVRNNAGAPSESLTITVQEDIVAPQVTAMTPSGGYYSTVLP